MNKWFEHFKSVDEYWIHITKWWPFFHKNLIYRLLISYSINPSAFHLRHVLDLLYLWMKCLMLEREWKWWTHIISSHSQQWMHNDNVILQITANRITRINLGFSLSIFHVAFCVHPIRSSLREIFCGPWEGWWMDLWFVLLRLRQWWMVMHLGHKLLSTKVSYKL